LKSTGWHSTGPESVVMVAVTAGEIRLLASAKLLGDLKRSGQMDAISVPDVLDVLRMQLTVAECDVFMYPSVESDVIVIVAPIIVSPTLLQVRV